MTGQTDANKKLTASDRKLLLEVINNDFQELHNQLEPKARAWHNAQLALIQEQYGDDSDTVEAITRECQEALEAAELLLKNKERDLENRGFSKNCDTTTRLYFPTRWQNTAHQKAVKELNRQFNMALSDGRAAINTAWSAAKKKVLMHSIQSMGEVGQLVADLPSLDQILGKYLTGPSAIES